jgi:hypothetical protein
MKVKIILIALLCVVSLSEITAQTSKGSFLIGGSLSVHRYHNEYSGQIPGFHTQAQLVMTPTVGYFIIDNLMVGIQPTYYYSWMLNTDRKVTQFSAGPVMRYYFPIGKISIFPEVTALYNEEIAKGTYLGLDIGSSVYIREKFNYLSYKAGIGAAWFIVPNIGIEGILGYRGRQYYSGSQEKSKFLSLNFGIQFYLPRKSS